MMKERDFDIMLNACKQRQQFYKYVSELVKPNQTTMNQEEESKHIENMAD